MQEAVEAQQAALGERDRALVLAEKAMEAVRVKMVDSTEERRGEETVEACSEVCWAGGWEV